MVLDSMRDKGARKTPETTVSGVFVSCRRQPLQVARARKKAREGAYVRALDSITQGLKAVQFLRG